MDKSRIRERLVALEAAELQESRDAYNQYVAGARVDTGGGGVDDQDGSQAAQSRDLAEAFDCPLHDQVHKLDLIERIDFGPKSKVEPGAVVKLDGRNFVIGVASGVFDYDGQPLMGLSPEAPSSRTARPARPSPSAVKNTQSKRWLEGPSQDHDRCRLEPR